jgi:hypothetical protein
VNAGGETIRLCGADNGSARTLAAQVGRAAVVAAGNRDAVQGVDAVILALSDITDRLGTSRWHGTE